MLFVSTLCHFSSPGVSYFTPFALPKKIYIFHLANHTSRIIPLPIHSSNSNRIENVKDTASQERKKGRRENAALRRTKQGKLTYIAGRRRRRSREEEKLDPLKSGR
jgi:hypothetical protein